MSNLQDSKRPPPPSFEQATGTTVAGPSTSAQPPSFRSRFACVTFNSSDKIRFISFPPEDVNAIRAIVRVAWPKGEQRFAPYGVSQEIKLNGNPWTSHYSGRNASRRLTRALLAGLYDRGWVLQAGVDACKKGSDKDSLIFRLQVPPPPPCEWLAVSFDRGDRLTIIDTPPPDVCAAVTSAFRYPWQGEPMVQKTERTAEHLQVKFRGYPWRPSGPETVKTRLLLLSLFEALEGFGYSLYANIDQEADDEGEGADVLIFARQKGWQPGMPVFHR